MRYQCEGNLGPAHYCHCEDCRRCTGSINVAVRVGAHSFKIIAGSPRGFTKQAESAFDPKRTSVTALHMSAVLFDRRPGTVSALRYCKPRRDHQIVVAGCRDLRVKHITLIPGGLPMRLSFAIRVALIALTATIGLATAAYADSGRIRFNVIKAGFVFGGSAGKGTLA
ncbi:MAG TPA: GFA family protein, partial [Pseudolabrys sp.]|nr:GFA family protein [Pseudolabrys sp.]